MKPPKRSWQSRSVGRFVAVAVASPSSTKCNSIRTASHLARAVRLNGPALLAAAAAAACAPFFFGCVALRCDAMLQPSSHAGIVLLLLLLVT